MSYKDKERESRKPTKIRDDPDDDDAGGTVVRKNPEPKRRFEK